MSSEKIDTGKIMQETSDKSTAHLIDQSQGTPLSANIPSMPQVPSFPSTQTGDASTKKANPENTQDVKK